MLRHSQKEVVRHAMKQYADSRIPTLQAALFDYMNSEDLRKLGALTKQKLPTRKGDLADVTYWSRTSGMTKTPVRSAPSRGPYSSRPVASRN
jgi:hypothetical protein